MKLHELLAEGVYNDAEVVTKRLNQHVSDIAGAHTALFWVNHGHRMWTRGDGFRHKEPNVIRIYGDDWEYVRKKYPEVKKAFPDPKHAMEWAWKEVTGTPGAKDIGRVSGEFRSSSLDPAVQIGRTIFIHRGNEIEYGSKSLLRGPVRRHERPE